MNLKHLLIALTVGLCAVAPAFAGTVFQFDEKGNASLTDNGVAKTVTVGQGFFDSLGPINPPDPPPSGTLMYTLPSGYTFGHQSAVIITDSSTLVSDLLIFRNSGTQGQVLVWDSPAAAASESQTPADLARAYDAPRLGGNIILLNGSYDLNSPAYLTYALQVNDPTDFTNHIVNAPEVSVNTVFGNGWGWSKNGGDSTIKGSTTTVTFLSEVPLPAAVWPGLGMLGALAAVGLLRRKLALR